MTSINPKAGMFRQRTLSPTSGDLITTDKDHALTRHHSQKQQVITAVQMPAFPTTQPPMTAPLRASHSANSSQNSGYYSISSLAAAANSLAETTILHNNNNQRVSRGDSAFGKASVSSRAPSAADEEEDDGFYDNIRTTSLFAGELDNVSVSSQTLPPIHNGKNGGRIGQLIRKIGGGGHKPPTSAASLVSLNKVCSFPIKSNTICFIEVSRLPKL